MAKLCFVSVKPARQVLQNARLRLRHAEHQVINALLAARDGVLHARENGVLRQLRQRIVGAQQLVVDGLRYPFAQRQQLVGQFLLGANHQLRRRRRRRRAQVGDEVADGEIGLVPDGGDDRDLGSGDHARQAFIIEGEEVLEGAAAARDDDDIHFAVPIEVADARSLPRRLRCRPAPAPDR